MRKQKGFTLIELLVVIAIIGLLSTLAVVALNNARLKSRDARRVADIKQMQTALELYFNDCGLYPLPVNTVADGSIAADDGTCPGSETTKYMAIIPDDPTPGEDYVYTQTGGTGSYEITYTLEGPTGGMDTGDHTATPNGIND